MAAAPQSPPVVVISSSFVAPYPVELTVVTVDRDATVTDINGTVIFRMNSERLTLHRRRTLMDPSGKVLVTMLRKMYSTETESYKVTIYPNVDYAFIICLVAVIIRGIEKYRKFKMYEQFATGFSMGAGFGGMLHLNN
ncbi:Protein LURP-one-related 15 [Linum perenne]